MNRYRISYEVPKHKARNGKGETVVARIVKELKKAGIEPKVRLVDLVGEGEVCLLGGFYCKQCGKEACLPEIMVQDIDALVGWWPDYCAPLWEKSYSGRYYWEVTF